jgi:hypothetical protein
MKRSSFFKSLVALVAAPSVLAGIKIKDSPVKVAKVDKSLFKDLQLLTPDYYKHYVEKYGKEDFNWWLAEVNKIPHETRELHWFETPKLRHGAQPFVGESCTITIKKEDHA